MGNVVTRFPPEVPLPGLSLPESNWQPSGYLHIGHAKAAILNASAARDYEGKLILRFDDTNPSKEKAEFQDSQREDLTTLGIHPDEVTYTSNYFDQIEERCRQLILSGKAYCDDTAVEEVVSFHYVFNESDEKTTDGWDCK
jgi:glutamyl-tRNA synthetase